ncbi:hypothetical protein EKO27_g1345 [Xylaria grammica]|uniref:Uncharacterized protein n=1 Tax=Xylaria grammica TaxID=363999 RepID=A0A439DH89_9PEZI|nr:hypothetical protein EKO27_g1345 [Xylaria grammica]
MPPKRKSRANDVVASDSEPETVALRRPTGTALLPAVMNNIEMLKTKRDRDRKDVAAKFDAYVAERKKAIADHYAAEAEKRSTEAKALLIRYAEVLERRASIEDSIEKLVEGSANDIDELCMLLEAVCTGRRGQLDTAAGSFASITPKEPTKTPATGLTARWRNIFSQGDTRANEGEEKGQACNDDDAHKKGEREGENPINQIFW